MTRWHYGVTFITFTRCPRDTLSVVRESRESIEIDWFLISHEADGAALLVGHESGCSVNTIDFWNSVMMELMKHRHPKSCVLKNSRNSRGAYEQNVWWVKRCIWDDNDIGSRNPMDSLVACQEREEYMKFCQVFFASGAMGLHHLLLQWGVVLTRFGRAWDSGPFTEGLIQNQGSFPSCSINLYLLQFWGLVVTYGLVLGLLNFYFFNFRVSSFLIS